MERLLLDHFYNGTVEGYSSEGLGIVRINGAVVFVPRAVCGETVKLRITKVMKTCYAGEIECIAVSSPERVEPDCPYFGECCAYRHVSYAEELRAKKQKVQDALERIGGLDLRVEEILGARDTLHYRNKAQYPVGSEGAVGFYRQRSHRVIPVEHCRICAPAADASAGAVGAWMKKYGVPAYDERTGRGLARHVYVRTSQKGESLCCVVLNGRTAPREPELAAMVLAAAPQTVGVVLSSNTRRDNVVLGDRYRTLWGQDFLMDELCGLRFKLSVPSFYQVNREQAEVLYGKAVELAGLTGTETVLDLYCGAGTITLAMSGRAKRVIGAEIVPEAIENAKENAARNGVRNAEFFCGDASDIAAKLERDGLRPDVICVDPPRKGLKSEVISSVTAMEPKRVVYVSCDPATLARDLKRFGELGYQAERAVAVDLFPGTCHVECVVLMSRVKTEYIEIPVGEEKCSIYLDV